MRPSVRDRRRVLTTGPRRLLAVLSVCALSLAACADDAEPEAAEDADTEGEADDEPEDDEEPEEEPEAEEEPEENPLVGETLSFVVPFDPGGGYDTAARAIAPLLEEELDATIAVENQPGAGGLQAVNSLIAGDQSGLSFMIIPGVGIASASLAGADGADFDVDELSYIGRTVADPHVFMVGADTEYESLADVMAQDDFRFASLGPGSAAAVNGAVLFAAFGGNPDVVSGFDGSGDIFAAIIRGDVEGMTLDNLEEVEANIDAGDVRALAVLGEEAPDVTPDAPIALDEAETDETAELMEVHNSLIEVGRPLITAPDVPEDVLQAYRDAVEAVLTDPDNIAALEDEGVPIDFLNGPDMESVIGDLAGAPDEYVSLLEEAYAEG